MREVRNKFGKRDKTGAEGRQQLIAKAKKVILQESIEEEK